jgi:hypothetical protein
MRVLLRRKLAECIDGVDLSGHQVGDVFELPTAKAWLLVAEQWAIVERRSAMRGEGGQRSQRRASGAAAVHHDAPTTEPGSSPPGQPAHKRPQR